MQKKCTSINTFFILNKPAFNSYEERLADYVLLTKKTKVKIK